MTYNASSRKHVREAEKAQVIISTIDREVISGLMMVKNGRHWVHEQLANSFVFRDPFSPDAAIHAYQAGLRATGIKLFNDLILYAPDNLILMMKEAHERYLIADARSANRAAADDNHPGYDADGTPIPGYWESTDAEGTYPTQ